MKNRNYIVIGIVLVLVFASTLVFYSKQDENTAIGTISFESTDLQGVAVDDSIFNNYELTMINIWGTFCSPCIEEMPELEELYAEIKEQNVNILGIISDIESPVLSEDAYDEAQNIVEEMGITYKNILPDNSLKSNLLNRVVGVPTTIFVDKDGNVVGEIVVGVRSKLEYKKLIEKYLEVIRSGK